MTNITSVNNVCPYNSGPLFLFITVISPSLIRASFTEADGDCMNKVAKGTLPWTSSLDANQYIQGRQGI